jgi:maltose O-acetyltransferase
MNPLSRPPIGPHFESSDSRGSLAPGAGSLSSFVDEAREFLAASTDARRLAWNASQVLPAFLFPRARARLLAMLGADIRRGAGVLGHLQLVGPRDCQTTLRIGPGSIIGPDVVFCLDAPISIGKNVSIGPRAMLYTATHPLGGPSRRMELGLAARPIFVEDGAWVGLGAVILAGVRLGRGCVVAAGSVVNADVPDNVLVAGNPARVIEELPT